MAVRFAEALGLGHDRAARALSAPSDAAAARSLLQLRRWLDRIPIARIDARAARVTLPGTFARQRTSA